MPVFDAASSSRRSTKRPASISTHAAQVPQGSAVTPLVMQLRLFAKMPRDRRLADAARAGEEVRVMEPVARERVGERGHHVLLPDELPERLRPPLAGECLVTHRNSRRARREMGRREARSVLPSDRSETRLAGRSTEIAVISVSGEARRRLRTRRVHDEYTSGRNRGVTKHHAEMASNGWRAVPPALAAARYGCFLPDLTRFTTLQCGATRR